jgi:hypothetical protein
MWAGLAPVGAKVPCAGSGGELGPIGRLFTPLFGEFRKIDQTRPDFTMLFSFTMIFNFPPETAPKAMPGTPRAPIWPFHPSRTVL